MKKTLILVVLWLSGVTAGRSQPTLERLAYSNLQKGKWAKAKMQAEKAMRKDSVNALAHYILAHYYFTPGNPDFNIDSAYRHTMLSLSDFQYSSPRQRERMRRFPMDSALVIRQREQVDSAAFHRAKARNTEQSYIDFITRFPFAAQRPLAAELRDEVAYLDALKENTYAAFRAYLEKYPASARAYEANFRYQKLLYEAETRDKKLASYERFLRDHPETPYRKEVEQQVFEIATAAGNRKAFENFLHNYPQSVFASKARNLLYYLLKERDDAVPSWLLTDSLRHARNLEQAYLVPFFREGMLGFMDAYGKEVIAPFAEDLSTDYRCGNITEDVLIGDSRIIARNGKIIFEGAFEEVQDLGWGFLVVKSSGCTLVIHKSGFTIPAGCLTGAAVAGGGRVLALKDNREWKLTTLSGRLLFSGVADVLDFDEVLVLRWGVSWRICRIDELIKAADQLTPALSRPYHEVKRWKDALWVRFGELQGLLDLSGKEVVALQKHEITPSFFGALVSSVGNTRIWQKGKPPSPAYSRIKANEPWIAVEQNKKWFVFDRVRASTGGRAYDSVFFTGPVLAGSYADSLAVYFDPYNFIELPRTVRLSFLPGKDSVFYILIEHGLAKTVYDSKGNKLFSSDFDRITYAGESYFTVIKNEKRGVLSVQGKLVLPAEFDGVGNLSEGTLPVLKDKKFGMADLVTRRQVKPEYSKNLIRYNSNYLVAARGNAVGLIGWDNKPVLPFEFEEIRYWNDSAALVKKDFQWIIYNFIEKKQVVNRIRDFKWILDSAAEKILIFRQDNHYGVIHNRKGYILPATYTDIINLGSVAQPMYFTEKYVEEASIYVVIYYDSNGRLLRRQVFEADDYDTIYCTHH